MNTLLNNEPTFDTFSVRPDKVPCFPNHDPKIRIFYISWLFVFSCDLCTGWQLVSVKAVCVVQDFINEGCCCVIFSIIRPLPTLTAYSPGHLDQLYIDLYFRVSRENALFAYQTVCKWIQTNHGKKWDKIAQPNIDQERQVLSQIIRSVRSVYQYFVKLNSFKLNHKVACDGASGALWVRIILFSMKIVQNCLVQHLAVV